MWFHVPVDTLLVVLGPREAAPAPRGTKAGPRLRGHWTVWLDGRLCMESLQVLVCQRTPRWAEGAVSWLRETWWWEPDGAPGLGPRTVWRPPWAAPLGARSALSSSLPEPITMLPVCPSAGFPGGPPQLGRTRWSCCREPRAQLRLRVCPACRFPLQRLLVGSRRCCPSRGPQGSTDGPGAQFAVTSQP